VSGCFFDRFGDRFWSFMLGYINCRDQCLWGSLYARMVIESTLMAEIMTLLSCCQRRRRQGIDRRYRWEHKRLEGGLESNVTRLGRSDVQTWRLDVLRFRIIRFARIDGEGLGGRNDGRSGPCSGMKLLRADLDTWCWFCWFCWRCRGNGGVCGQRRSTLLRVVSSPR